MQKLQSDGKNVTWNKYDCTPAAAFAANNTVSDEPIAKAVVPAQQLFGVNVYPNPTRSDFKVEIKGSDNTPVSIKITDMSGRPAGSVKVIRKGSVTSVGQELKAGSYFVEIIQGNNRKVVKLIKLD